MKDSGTHSYLWKSVFPSWLASTNSTWICKYSLQQKSIDGQNQQDKPCTAYLN